MGWDVTPDPLRAEEAIAWFRQRVPMSDADAAALDAHAKRRAFWVAGLAELDLVNEVQHSLDHSLDSGSTFEEWKQQIGAKILKGWAGSVANPGHRLDLIFRNNHQLAYSSGRYRQLRDPAVAKFREFWTLDTVADDRRSPICNDIAAAFEGKWLEASNPWWQDGHIPPFHHGCRTAIRSARRATAEKDGILTKGPDVSAQKGFGQPPGADEWKQLEQLEADKLADTAPAIAKTYKTKAAAAPKGPPPEHDPAHWEKEYAHLGDAAKAAAWGRAMHERGLDMRPSEVIAELEHLAKPGDHSSPELNVALVRLKSAMAANPNWTMRKIAAEGSNEAPNFEHRIHALSALAAQAKAMRGASMDVKIEVDAQAIHDHRKEVARATAFYATMAHKSLTFNGTYVQFSGGPRASYYEDALVTGRANMIEGGIARRGTIEHELGHAAEAQNPKARAAAHAFLDARVGEEEPVNLREYTGNAGYVASERACPDHFRNPYVGKKYYYATEVTSMGAEWLATEPHLFLRDDAEHFHFTLGVLANELLDTW